MKYDSLPLLLAVSWKNRDWGFKRGLPTYAGWIDCVCDKNGGSTKWYSRTRKGCNSKRKTIRTFRDGSSARNVRLY